MSAYEILKALAHKCAAGETITFAKDWCLGSGTLILQDGSHTHFGADIEDDEKKAVDDFIHGLHALLVNGTGISLCPSPNKSQSNRELPDGFSEESAHEALEGSIEQQLEALDRIILAVIDWDTPAAVRLHNEAMTTWTALHKIRESYDLHLKENRL